MVRSFGGTLKGTEYKSTTESEHQLRVLWFVPLGEALKVLCISNIQRTLWILFPVVYSRVLKATKKRKEVKEDKESNIPLLQAMLTKVYLTCPSLSRTYWFQHASQTSQLG